MMFPNIVRLAKVRKSLLADPEVEVWRHWKTETLAEQKERINFQINELLLKADH
jgi:hypothetical protein